MAIPCRLFLSAVWSAVAAGTLSPKGPAFVPKFEATPPFRRPSLSQQSSSSNSLSHSSMSIQTPSTGDQTPSPALFLPVHPSQSQPVFVRENSESRNQLSYAVAVQEGGVKVEPGRDKRSNVIFTIDSEEDAGIGSNSSTDSGRLNQGAMRDRNREPADQIHRPMQGRGAHSSRRSSRGRGFRSRGRGQESHDQSPRSSDYDGSPHSQEGDARQGRGHRGGRGYRNRGGHEYRASGHKPRGRRGRGNMTAHHDDQSWR